MTSLSILSSQVVTCHDDLSLVASQGGEIHTEEEFNPCIRVLNWRVLIATCKQLVWSIRIGRNIPIWVLCLILGSGPGAALPLEVTGPCSRAIGTWSPRSSAYRAVYVPSVEIPTPRTHTSTVYRAVSQVPPHFAASMVILPRLPHQLRGAVRTY
jgi:hypothetical protein